MTLTDLRYIVALARARHFGRAAERCHVSQPTLSVAVKKLEDELGVVLFERGASELRVTRVGEQIVAQAETVLAEAAKVKELADQGKDPLVGPFRLGVIYTVGPYLLPRLIPILHRRAPRMPLLIKENYTARLTEALRRGDLDAIVISLPYSEQGFATRVIYDEPFRVVMPAGHPWAGEVAIPAQRLADEALLLLGAGNCFRDQVLAVCPRLTQGRGLQRTLEGSSLETIRHMVASGLGVTVLPSSAADPLPSIQTLLSVRPFAPPEPFRQVALTWRLSYPRHQAIDLLCAATLEAALPGTLPVQGALEHLKVLMDS